ncbi:MAG: glucose 1-dehydrogenase [Methanospirillum sp.]|nr:glucose 1-dehydrogenase [Methanospirillum sp.]
MGKLNDRVCIITGSTSGIGEACAKEMAAEGGKIVVSGRNEKEGARVVGEITAKGGTATFVRADVASEDDIRNLVAKAVEVYGRLDVMVANSGIGLTADIHELSTEDWDTMMDINLKGVFLCDKYAVIQMLAQGDGGAIVNTGSIHSYVAKQAVTAYATTKGGVRMLTRTVGTSYAAQGIRANFVAPGYIDTPLLKGLPPEVYQELINLHPIGRLGRAEEVAKAVAFLASDDASFITGTGLLIDGGYTAL